ncbi:MAG: hypothetical protein JW939_08055 [Candidatus Thermoplasmatota archaeon]|nr:hypothetical protein [Candidatus Thermoplasmatota archaeon]
METNKKMLPLFLALILLTGSMLLFPLSGNAAGEPQTRNSLYLYTENHNISFNKPTFYGTDDPYNTEDVEANDWDDISIVVFFQDQKKSTKTVGSYSLSVADMYQAVYVPLNGTQRSTGTARTVMLEDITAVWCGPCSGVIGAMDRLNHDSSYFPDKYIGIEYHASSSGDVYYTTASRTRGTYYSFGAYPTVIVDGTDASVGGASSPNTTSIDTQFKSRINTAAAVASPMSIVAVGGHDDTKAWVNFTVKVEDSSFENIKVDANVLLVQDAHPRRHNANKEARLGLIVENINTFRVFNVQGSPPIISNVLPTEGSVLTGTADISFDVTDPDASDDKISSTVEVRPIGGLDWTGIKKVGAVYPWNTAAKSGEDYLYPDGDYEVRITSRDYWDEESTVTFGVSVHNPDVPTVTFKDQLIQDQFDDGMVEGEFDIIWQAEDDEDGSDVSIDLYYKRSDIAWTPIAEGISNVGYYTWDTSDPRVPDNDGYLLMIRATDSDMSSAEATSAFLFEINNPDPPTLQITSPREGQELSGKPTIRWDAQDDEDTTTKLTAEVSISDDGGSTYSSLTPGPIPNSGSYQFDTTYYEDGTNYMVMVKVTDTTGLYAEAGSEIFSIYNNDAPECRILEPAEEDLVMGTLTVEWSSHDEEDASEDLTFDLYYKFSGGTYWKELVVGEPNTGSYELDTLDLEEGDGIYTIRLTVSDSRGIVSSDSTVYFTVYNPDAPEIISTSGPTSTVSKIASFNWYAEDPDPAETDGLKIWFYYLDGSEWRAVAEGIPNTGSFTLDVSGFEDGTYSVKMVVADCQPDDMNRTAEHLFPEFEVDNNDPPTLEMTSAPDPYIEHENEITFSWTGSDPEGDKLYYTAYYHKVGESSWSMIPGAFKISTTSFNWDISLLPAGDYEIRLVVVEDTKDSFETEVISQSFRIKEKEVIIDDDDDDDTLPPVDDDEESNLGLFLGIAIAITVLIILVLIVLALVILKRRKEAQQLPPPGGVPMMPPGGQLPGSVAGGELAPQQSPSGLPPSPAPQLPPSTPQEPQPAPQTPPGSPPGL